MSIMKQQEQKQSMTSMKENLPRFKNRYNMHLFPIDAEKVGQPSTTVPDMSFSIEDIISRFTRGLPITGQKFEIFEEEEIREGDEVMPDLTFTSKLELQEIQKRYSDELERINERAIKRTERIKKQMDQRQKKELEELKAKLSEQKKADQGDVPERT